ncbi:MAG: hypothetical protein ACRDFX_10155, partial [Chloroflexota bacterium]
MRRLILFLAIALPGLASPAAFAAGSPHLTTYLRPAQQAAYSVATNNVMSARVRTAESRHIQAKSDRGAVRTLVFHASYARHRLANENAAGAAASQIIQSARSLHANVHVRISALGTSRSSVRGSASVLALPSDLITSGDAQFSIASGEGPFKSYHQNYSGFVDGVAATFDFQPLANVYYTGSIFSDNHSAAAFMAEGVANTSGPNSSDCTATFNLPCFLSAFSKTNGDLAVYQVAQIN